MIQRANRHPGPAGMFAISLCCHLALAFLIAWSQLLPAFKKDEAPVTYVDMVTLPVASPQSGAPSPQPAPRAPAAAAQTPAPPAAMTLPKAPPAKTKAPATKADASAPKAKPAAPAVEDARRFDERLEKIQRLAEEKRQSEVFENLKKKRKVGMPGATGTESGADYASYLQSRLKDAFVREVTAPQIKAPTVIATVTIGADGRIAEYRVEKTSGDPLFDDAVARAVNVAGSSLRPPPGGAQFRRRFRFMPEEVVAR